MCTATRHYKYLFLLHYMNLHTLYSDVHATLTANIQVLTVLGLRESPIVMTATIVLI